MQPGDRVQAHNPQLGDEERVPLKVDPDSSRLLRLRMTKDDGSGLDIALLRSLLWMERHQAYAGERIWLDLPELGAQGYADVIGEEPCPALMPGEAPLVTGKFVHAAANVVDLYVSGLAEPIGVTANHPFWSETRQDFVEAGDLVAGEALRGDGDQPLLVLHAIPRPEPQTVYNLEVDGEHVYAVTERGILVHNACVHGNSLLSQRQNHGYAIINRHTGEIYKFGISGGKLTQAGDSYRAMRQLGGIANANKLTKADLQVVTFRNLGNRWHAVQWEKQAVGFFRDRLKVHDLPNNRFPKGNWPNL